MKKKNLMKKIVGIAVCAVLTISMVGCGGSDDKNKDSENKVDSSAGKTDDTVVDLEGYEFVVASPYIQDEPDMESIMGSERSFEEARQYVEDTYNCKIKVTMYRPNMENLRASTMTGTKYADIVHIPMTWLLQAINAGYVQELNNVKGLYLDDYRWVESCTNIATYDGSTYGLNFMRPSEVRTCLVYNKEVLKQCGVTEDLEQLVRDGQWTFDKFEEIAKKCTKDTNGDGISDIFGMYTALDKELGLSLINSNGGSLVEVVDGKAQESFTSEKAITALNYLSKWINTDKIIANKYGTESNLGSTTTTYANYFVDGDCAFLFCESWLVTQNLKNIAGDLEYGMLPLPKGPDTEDYASNANNALVFAIPSTNTEDLDKTVIVLNALAKAIAGEENDSEAQEAYDYDIMMEYFGKENANGAEMYNFVLSKSYVDYGCAIDTLYSDFASTCIIDTCYRNFATPASAVESISGVYDSLIDSVYN